MILSGLLHETGKQHFREHIDMTHMQAALTVSELYDLAQNPDHKPAVLFLFIDLIRDKRDQPTLLCIKLDRIKHTLKYDLGIKRSADIV